MENHKGLATREDFSTGKVYFELRDYKNGASRWDCPLDFLCASRWYNDDFTAKEMHYWMIGHKEGLRVKYKHPHVALFFVDERKGIEKLLESF